MIDRKHFETPVGDPRYSLAPFWFWNDHLEKDVLTGQLEVMKETGMTQPVIHARTYMEPGCIDYLGEEWFDNVGHALEVIRKNGMRAWIYDENNWPSGTADCTVTKKVENREHFLQFDDYALEAGGFLQIDLAKRSYLNITFYPDDGDAVFPAGECLDARILDFTAPADGELRAVYVAVDSPEMDDSRHSADSWDHDEGRRSVDYLSEKAIGEFMELTHEQYYRHFADEFGKTIKGFFMDETRFCNAYPWTEGFEKKFRARKGYDIVAKLPLLRKDSEESAFIRYDYFDVISDLCNENTFKRVFDWCEERGVIATAHFLGEETLSAQSFYNGDLLRYYKYLHAPGLDHLGNGIGSLNIKMGVSAAYNYGSTDISCEAFAGAGRDAGYEDIQRIANWLYQQGVNIFMVHGMAYSLRGEERMNDWPPSYFTQWKDWNRMPGFSRFVERMSLALSSGYVESDILIYHPVETFWNHFVPDQYVKIGYFKDGPAIENSQAARMDHDYQILCNSLLNENLDFQILNSDAAGNFTVEDSRIINTLTGASWQVLVLPYVEVIPEPVLKLVQELIDCGGKVLFYNTSIEKIVGKAGNHRVAGSGDVLAVDESCRFDSVEGVVEACRSMVTLPFEITSGVNRVDRTRMAYPEIIFDPYIHDGEDQSGIAVTRFLNEDCRIFNVTNYNPGAETITLSVCSESAPVIFVPETGEVRGLSADRQDGGDWSVTIEIPANRTVLLECGLPEKDKE